MASFNDALRRAVSMRFQWRGGCVLQYVTYRSGVPVEIHFTALCPDHPEAVMKADEVILTLSLAELDALAKLRKFPKEYEAYVTRLLDAEIKKAAN